LPDFVKNVIIQYDRTVKNAGYNYITSISLVQGEYENVVIPAGYETCAFDILKSGIQVNWSGAEFVYDEIILSIIRA